MSYANTLTEYAYIMRGDAWEEKLPGINEELPYCLRLGFHR